MLHGICRKLRFRQNREHSVGLENENVRNAICECVVDFLRETTATSE